ncbi:MAG TPA: DUF3096 domain-containing protein [Stellaceae bacterium]|nr:DUF3096 domain-containing protein [Stellaceae bacterium]
MWGIGASQWQPMVALGAGILILIEPRVLVYVVALYLIMVGLIGLDVIS